MSKDEVFQLYKRVQNKDRDAEDTLIAEHRRLYPRSTLNAVSRGDDSEYRRYLHIMYGHVYQKSK